ncbi:class I adenylate-forming enzyme family protein [Butyrivibrio sp. MB2005]|uniref:class I adenylate-forming enzyme family protein n=1 Tax=Butyrivibrio sp. MB2005 TaxID=1280678 RepID=UPI00040C49D4|nr:class I adenylate-forming enzyme family protein [Butyrivibrio sp. MB2005]
MILTDRQTGYPSVDKPWMKYYNQKALSDENPAISIYEWIYTRNRKYEDYVAISYFGNQIRYKELFDEVERAASSFEALGVKKGDIVTLALPNIPENVICIYALNRIGAIANIIDLRCQGNDLIRYYNEVNSLVAVISDIFLDNTLQVLDKTRLSKIVIASPYDRLSTPLKAIMRRKINKAELDSLHALTWKSFISKGSGEVKGIPGKTEETACILHTSGTTGEAKGVMLSNRCFNAMAFQCERDGYTYYPGDKCLNWVPPFLAYNALMAMHLPLSLHMQIEMIPEYKPEKSAKNIMKYKPNHVMAGPADWVSFTNTKGIKDLSYLRSLSSGGDSLRAEEKHKINEILKEHGCMGKILQGYGMTEVGSAASSNLPQVDVDGSVGIPLPLMTFCIWDNEANREMKYDEEGEICIAGPTLMNGYYNKEDESKAVMRIHSDGRVWMHTGDLGRIDTNGCIYLEGRLKRIIIQYNGMKINPYEIEATLLEDTSIENCCVVGVPDIDHGTGAVPKAYVVLKPGLQELADQIEKQLREKCEKNLVERYRPKQIQFIEALPLTANGKVDYRSLEGKDL